jgi:hypothetical protein
VAKDNNFFSEATERASVMTLSNDVTNLKPDGGCCMLQPSQGALLWGILMVF